MWKVLLDADNNLEQLLEISEIYTSLVGLVDLKQINADVKRNEHFHPLMKSEQVQKTVVCILQLLSIDHVYIQGLDSICINLLLQFQDSSKLSVVLSIFKSVYRRYLKPFISSEDNNLSFS